MRKNDYCWSNRIGRLVNYQDLANMTNLSVATVKNYLWYCEKTFIVEAVLPYFTNKEKELTKTPQYYFIDSGLRNFLLNNFDLSPLSPDFGFAFQQLVYQMLKSRFLNGIEKIRYWRTQNQAEVDFVVQDGISILPLEVKAERMKVPVIERSMRNFIATYEPTEAWVVNRGLRDQIQLGRTNVKFIPWYDLLV